MKQIAIALSVSLLLSSLSCANTVEEGSFSDISKNRDATFNIYGVNAKKDRNQESTSGAGIMFDSEVVKVKVEGTSDYIKSGLVLKYNPFTKNWYFKVGANYLNQKMYAPDSSTARVNQYSGALSTGYMILDDLYVEVGGSATQLKGSMVGTDYQVKNERTSIAYLEVAKRWENPIGTIDTTVNGGRVYHELSRDENSYGAGLDYYPLDNAKLGYKYQYEKNNISNVYSAQYGLLFAEYVDNISTKTYQVTAGLKIAFGDFTDISTYGIPQKIKPHLSELNKFEDITFGANMNIQSTSGVERATAVPNSTPNAFTFTDVTSATLNTLYTSNTITVSGVNTASAISVANGEYQINGGAWTTVAGTVNNGDTVAVRHTSSATPATATNTTLTIGGVSDIFTTTTVPADTTPAAFTFTDINPATASTLYTSNTITVSGINTAASISVSGGNYQINGGAWTAAAGTINNGDTFAVQQTSGISPSVVNVTLTIGGVSDTYTLTVP